VASRGARRFTPRRVLRVLGRREAFGERDGQRRDEESDVDHGLYISVFSS